VNEDGYADLVGLTSQGYIDVHDVHGQSLLWRSTQLGNGVALAVSDLDDDGEEEIIVALIGRIVVYGKALIGSSYLERASIALTGAVDLVAADLNGDNDQEIYVLRQDSWGANATLAVLDSQLQAVRTVPLGVPATALFVEQSAFARKNLVLAVGGNFPVSTPAQLWAIDPTTGVDVWRSPELAGSLPPDSLYFVDVDGDGDREISFATTDGMYHTR
jgi:hypothetical protein